jgi:DNA-binding GntR family transcriptional regulator
VLADQVRDRLLERILDGSYPPDSRIVETSVAKELGTSQAPVREALRGLAELGVVEKAPFQGLTRQHATEWARHGIRVNAISPTFVRTPQAASLLADRDFYERLVSRIPLRRIADPDDMVGAILFFCSEAAGFVTGQVLTLDGGLTATQ